MLWWGIGLISAAVGGPLALIGPAVLTFTLVKVSGVAMLDRELVARRPGYAEYIASTPAFLPFRIGARGAAPQTGVERARSVRGIDPCARS